MCTLGRVIQSMCSSHVLRCRVHQVRCSSRSLLPFNEVLPPADRATVDRAVTDTQAQLSKFKQEFVDSWRKNAFTNVQPYQVHKVFTFDSMHDLARWVVTCDASHNQGFSSGEFALHDSMRTCVFRGSLDTSLPNDGTGLTEAGYCNITCKPEEKSFHRHGSFDWSRHTHVEVRCRGDGRTYLLLLGSRGFFQEWHSDVYCYPMHTRGGPHWQTTRIPFSKFVLMNSGLILDEQVPIPLDDVTSFGITVSQVSGHFQLELDYVGIVQDPHYREECAYESYRVPVGL